MLLTEGAEQGCWAELAGKEHVLTSSIYSKWSGAGMFRHICGLGQISNWVTF